MDFSDFFEFISPRAVTFLTAMTPVGELRASIPIALSKYGMNIFETYIISVLGNMIPPIAILWILDPVSKFLMSRYKLADRFFKWLFNRTRRKHSKRFKKYEGYALVAFVGTPLPITGGWTGALIAFVFGIPPKRALLHIFIGVLTAGIIVTTICQTVGYVKFIIAG
ncbi:MAG: small multi-drug export protein [Actinomycetota bacterium]|nr:small multi-drug export protein [Actinomycetota bacterium]